MDLAHTSRYWTSYRASKTFRFTVFVIEAHLGFSNSHNNASHGDGGSGPWDTKVTVSLPNDSLGEKHETCRARRTPNPVWEQAIVFNDVAYSELVRLEVRGMRKLGENPVLGTLEFEVHDVMGMSLREQASLFQLECDRSRVRYGVILLAFDFFPPVPPDVVGALEVPKGIVPAGCYQEENDDDVVAGRQATSASAAAWGESDGTRGADVDELVYINVDGHFACLLLDEELPLMPLHNQAGFSREAPPTGPSVPFVPPIPRKDSSGTSFIYDFSSSSQTYPGRSWRSSVVGGGGNTRGGGGSDPNSASEGLSDSSRHSGRGSGFGVGGGGFGIGNGSGSGFGSTERGGSIRKSIIPGGGRSSKDGGNSNSDNNNSRRSKTRRRPRTSTSSSSTSTPSLAAPPPYFGSNMLAQQFSSLGLTGSGSWGVSRQNRPAAAAAAAAASSVDERDPSSRNQPRRRWSFPKVNSGNKKASEAPLSGTRPGGGGGAGGGARSSSARSSRTSSINNNNNFNNNSRRVSRPRSWTESILRSSPNFSGLRARALVSRAGGKVRSMSHTPSAAGNGSRRNSSLSSLIGDEDWGASSSGLATRREWGSASTKTLGPALQAALAQAEQEERDLAAYDTRYDSVNLYAMAEPAVEDPASRQP